MFITETWLNQNIYSAELFDIRYNVYRMDREPKLTGKNREGGVLIAIKTNLQVERIHLFDIINFYCEYVWLKIKDHIKKPPYKQVSSTSHQTQMSQESISIQRALTVPLSY